MLSTGVLSATEVVAGCDSAGAGVSSDFLISGVAVDATSAVTFALALDSLAAGRDSDAGIGASRGDPATVSLATAGVGAGDFGGDAVALVPFVNEGALGEWPLVAGTTSLSVAGAVAGVGEGTGAGESVFKPVAAF